MSVCLFVHTMTVDRPHPPEIMRDGTIIRFGDSFVMPQQCGRVYLASEHNVNCTIAWKGASETAIRWMFVRGSLSKCC